MRSSMQTHVPSHVGRNIHTHRRIAMCCISICLHTHNTAFTTRTGDISFAFARSASFAFATRCAAFDFAVSSIRSLLGKGMLTLSTCALPRERVLVRVQGIRVRVCECVCVCLNVSVCVCPTRILQTKAEAHGAARQCASAHQNTDLRFWRFVPRDVHSEARQATGHYVPRRWNIPRRRAEGCTIRLRQECVAMRVKGPSGGAMRD
jgi:hypothetical protein